MAKNEITLSGTFKVEVNADKTEAFLVYASGSAEDKIWGVPDLIALLQSLNIAGVKPEELSRQLEASQQKKEKQFRILIAKGVASIPPAAQTLQLAALQIPEKLKEPLTKALAAADSPSIFQELQIKVEREKTVIKKGALPFMASKEETVLVTEKENTQQRVYIDPKVQSWTYAEAGQKIGIIFPAKQGVPGKTVDGEIVAPIQLAEPNFYPGENIARKGGDLTAAVSGIVRVGANWVDLVPFSEHSWSLSQSDDKATCFFDFTPGSPHMPLPKGGEIVTEALKLGYKAEEILEAPLIDNLIAIARENHTPLVHKSLSHDQDAFIDIVVGDDKLKAVLNVMKGSGHGKALVLNEVGKAINQSGLAIDKVKIKADIPGWFNGPDKALVGYVLAEGQAPQEAPKQNASYTAPFLEGKEYQQILAQVAAFPMQEMESFPQSAINGLAWIQKDQRVVTLGPLSPGAAGKDVYGTAIPGKPGESFQFQLYGFLEQIGPSLVIAKKTGILVKAEKENKTYLAAFEHLDGEMQIELADANMSAWIVLNAHRGTGKPLKRSDILAAIAKAGVKKGIEQETLERIIKASEESQDIERICFARGQAPQNGSPSEVRYLITFASGQGVTLRSDGTADFRNQDKITTVKKDTHIAEILPSSIVSQAGWDVLGKDLPAPSLPPIPIEIGANIRQQKESDGRTILVADVDGELRNEKNRLEIVAAYTLKGNVDASSGNIKFPGTVQIAGDVMTGFYIIAGGEIKIAGSVEGALLSADQDISIQNGVKGAGKALIRTKQNIMAGFIEHATLLAVGDIKIKKALLRSKLKCNGRLLMADDGKIVGGEIKLKQGMVVGDLGNATGVPTRIFFGQDILVEDQIEVEEKEVIKVQQDVAKLNTAMKSSEKLNDKEKLQEMFNEKLRLMKVLEKRNLRLFTLKERFEQHFESELIIKGTAYPGVVIESHGRKHEFQKPTKGIKVRFDTSSGRIVEEALGQKT